MALIKHVDFAPPGFGELTAGAQATGYEPGRVILREGEAVFPDGSGAVSGCGLTANLMPGVGGRYVEHALAAAEAVLSTRIMVGWGTCASGTLTLLRGLNAAGQASFTLTLDCESGAVAV